jgi:hypothetical protein
MREAAGNPNGFAHPLRHGARAITRLTFREEGTFLDTFVPRGRERRLHLQRHDNDPACSQVGRGTAVSTAVAIVALGRRRDRARHRRVDDAEERRD